jgi:hypothetical protein
MVAEALDIRSSLIPRFRKITKRISQAFGRKISAKNFALTFEPNPGVFGHYDGSHFQHQMTTLKSINGWCDKLGLMDDGNVLCCCWGEIQSPTSNSHASILALRQST